MAHQRVLGVWPRSSSSIYGRGEVCIFFFFWLSRACAIYGLCEVSGIIGLLEGGIGSQWDLVSCSLPGLFCGIQFQRSIGNYFIGIFFIVWVPFCRKVSLFYVLGSFVCWCLYFLSLFLNESGCFCTKKKKKRKMKVSMKLDIESTIARSSYEQMVDCELDNNNNKGLLHEQLLNYSVFSLKLIKRLQDNWYHSILFMLCHGPLGRLTVSRSAAAGVICFGFRLLSQVVLYCFEGVGSGLFIFTLCISLFFLV